MDLNLYAYLMFVSGAGWEILVRRQEQPAQAHRRGSGEWGAPSIDRGGLETQGDKCVLNVWAIGNNQQVPTIQVFSKPKQILQKSYPLLERSGENFSGAELQEKDELRFLSISREGEYI